MLLYTYLFMCTVFQSLLKLMWLSFNWNIVSQKRGWAEKKSFNEESICLVMTKAEIILMFYLSRLREKGGGFYPYWGSYYYMMFMQLHWLQSTTLLWKKFIAVFNWVYIFKDDLIIEGIKALHKKSSWVLLLFSKF